ncbi:LysE family translocator [Marinobacter sp. 71-i]|uniref:LysE family translocator n=1 Tax=Marinobacter iranensis TaxID=2962607 RepID=A0ABT5Y4T1_9GAMM|nr:LysE family translocator [Marinobacter iranensis]MDF0748678.1 LysE family translocator [Marinobacter iranensis]
MIEIFAYAIGVMYTPGPVNLLGLNSGINGHFRASTGFYIGVGCAMLVLFLLFGWFGSSFVAGDGLVVVSVLGCGYILYLAGRILRASVEVEDTGPSARPLRFRDGLVMQLLNPKGIVATLPIATIQFPGVGIHGAGLVLWSGVLSLLAIGAPGSYSLAGSLVGRRIRNPSFFRWFNRIMACLLIYVAVAIGYEYIYLPLQHH